VGGPSPDVAHRLESGLGLTGQGLEEPGKPSVLHRRRRRRRRRHRRRRMIASSSEFILLLLPCGCCGPSVTVREASSKSQATQGRM
jgi:hypothetical protein